jgi:small ligand-binding sensory domain FIST
LPTVFAGLGISEAIDPARAIDEAAAEARGSLDGDPELAIAFVSTAHGPLGAELCQRTRDLAGARTSAAVHVEGLLSETGERGATPVVAVLALGVAAFDLHSFDHARGREHELGEELVANLEPIVANDLVLVVADAHELDSRPLAAGLAQCAPAAVLGIGVEGPARGAAAHAIDGEVSTGGAFGLRLRAPRELRCALAPGAALRETRTVSRARGNWIFELDGVAALEEFRDAAGALWRDERRAMRSVLVALPDQPGGEPDPALVRGVVGIDPEQGAIALAESVESGERVAFARCDPLAAREALASAAERFASLAARSGIGLAASCRTRGEELFGQSGIESGYLAQAFRPGPWLGLVGSYQLAGTPGSASNLLTHTAALVRLV